MELMKTEQSLKPMNTITESITQSHSLAVVTYVLFLSALHSVVQCFIQTERHIRNELCPGLQDSFCAMLPTAKHMPVPTSDYTERCKSSSAIKGRMNPKQKINQRPSPNLPTSAPVLAINFLMEKKAFLKDLNI